MCCFRHTQKGAILGAAWMKVVLVQRFIEPVLSVAFLLICPAFLYKTLRGYSSKLKMGICFYCSCILLQLYFVSSTVYFCLELHSCICLQDKTEDSVDHHFSSVSLSCSKVQTLMVRGLCGITWTPLRADIKENCEGCHTLFEEACSI